MTARPPSTTGAIIRNARLRAVPKLSMEAAAARAEVSASHWGAIERDKPAVRATAATIARMLAVLPPLTDAERETLNRVRPEDSADILGWAAGDAGGPISAGDDDRLILAFIARHPESEVLEFLWRELGPDGKPAPRDRRIRRVLEWVERSAPDSESQTG